jgi:Arc/MetJ-type ribon-helix-helix transcriptional regulator
MVIGMADSRKVTITLPATTLDAVRRLVDAGAVPSVSGFVQHSVRLALDDVAAWDALLGEALASSGGELSEPERAWADQILESRRQTGAA